MCLSKNRYPDKLTACAAGAHFIETMQVDGLWYYRCPICRGWHLTRQNHGKKRNVLTILEG